VVQSLELGPVRVRIMVGVRLVMVRNRVRVNSGLQLARSRLCAGLGRARPDFKHNLNNVMK